ncbi:non-ribosomal peptide synthetase [uncultured Tenacibaculum sp.]|uniref:non-ribosomal peptide synthetase n=1 Tax=uncultured Tenacibaculum sp. TaxID=174713 RepID=UPI0026112C6D|nr:non-ribosomal peptide synthetase [uncultured Tenacibaculum sp.]
MEKLLLDIKKSGIRVNLDGEDLKLKIPKGFNNKSLLDRIKVNKVEVVNYLNNVRSKKSDFQEISKANSNFSKLTPSQLRLFAAEGLNTDSNVYNTPFAYELRGELDIEQIQKSFVKLIERHASLRTRFILDENHEPIQEILENFDFELKYQVSSINQLEEIKKNFSFPFNLERGPLIRAKLLKIEEKLFVLLVDIHHIVFDGISMKIFMQELFTVYQNMELPKLEINYVDYATWYHREDYQKKLRAQKDFWTKQLEGYSNNTVLPTDFKNQNELSFEGAYENFSISKERKTILDKLTKKYNVSLFSLLTALYGILQSKLTGVNDVLIGTPVAGRRHWSLENVIGMFVNTITVRMQPSGDLTFNNYLRKISAGVVKSFDNQEYPYESLVEDLGLKTSNGNNRLFNVIISLVNFAKNEEFKVGSLNIKPLEFEKSTAKFDFMMHFFEKDSGIDCTVEYDTKLFTKETIGKFFEYFTNIIDQVGINESIGLDKIDLLNDNSAKKLLELNNFSEVNYPKGITLVDIFEKQVEQTPNNIALISGENSYTYDGLNKEANKVARMLRSKGVGRNDMVGILMEKNSQTVITMLGILKAGGAYVPIDINYPQERIDYIIDNSKLKWVFSSEQYRELIKKEDILILSLLEVKSFKDVSNLPKMNNSSDIGYVIYTSGTTGQPKGVMVEHKNVVRLFFNDSFEYNFNENDVWTMFHSHCFDFSVWEMYGALFFGGKLVIVTPEEARDPSRYLEILQEYKVTVLNQTPTAFYSLNKVLEKENVTLPEIRYVIFGGEALSPIKLRKWKELHPKNKLVNMYGITEITVHATYKEIGDYEIKNGIGNIGKSIATGAIYLLDNNMKQVPIGVTGEIYVGGEGVARGYVNNPDLTNTRFIANPFKDGGRLYKTGDLGVLLSNGDIEYKGRIDRQVQLKGFRIELKEIEYHLIQYELIKDVVVNMAISDKEEPYLCAYYIGENVMEVSKLRSYLETKLPHYMIPSYYVKIEKIPFTSNNKIDFSKLPNPKTGISKKVYLAPRNKEEVLMCNIWQEFLGVNQVGLSDNFFSLGGDSLKAIGLISRVNKIFSSSLIIADIYVNPTVKEITDAIKSKEGLKLKDLRSEAEEELRLFQENYKKNNEFLDSYEEVYPMSGIEKGMVYHSLLTNSENEHDILYHEQNIYALPIENFNEDTFKYALKLLISKHEELRKIYDLNNLAHIILKEIEPDLKFIDISHLDVEEQKEFVSKKCEEEKLRQTELSMSLIWRMHVIKVREDYQYLLFDFNHSLIDGWSLSVFLRDLNNTYYHLVKNPVYVPKPIRGGYKDQIIEELMVSRDILSKNYWKKELEDYKRFELKPTGKPNEIITSNYDLGKEFRKELETVANKLNVSFKHLCYAALIFSLKRMTYENDLTVGVVSNTRPLILDGEELVGCFLNTVPFRVKAEEGFTWKEFIKYIDNKLIDLKYHECIPFYKILEFIDEKTINENPIFDVKLNYIDFRPYNEFENDEDDFLEKSTADTKAYLNENTPLNLTIYAQSEGLMLNLIHSKAFVEEEEADKLYYYVKSALEQIAKDFDQEQKGDSILIKEEYLNLTKNFNDTETLYAKSTTILDLFKSQVKKLPNRLAVTFKNKSLTYKELDEVSNQLANKLIDMGVKEETLVPISTDRSLEMIIGILGVLKAGGAYVPIDPTYVQKRIDYILDDIKSKFILTQSKFDSKFQMPKLFLDDASIYSENNNESPDVKVEDTSLIYVFYTSGTTGKPKGVMNTHEGVYNNLLWMKNHFEVNNEDNFLQKTNFCFDVSVWELLLPIISGSRIVFAKPEGHKDPKYIEKLIKDEDITLTHFVPSMLSLFLMSIENFNGGKLRGIFAIGEELKLSTVRDFKVKMPNVELHNLYGPTEAAIGVTSINVSNYNGNMVPIGKPIANTKIYIVNNQNEIQPIGVKGELLIGGIQVAKGYLNRTELTAEKFIKDPFNPNSSYKLYKTGDFARWLPDGTIEFLGRIDNQIKLRGNRIELGEIEFNLSSHSAIETSIVMLKEYNKTPYIVAYYLPNQKESLDTDYLKDYLKESLPEYMIPSYFVELSELPLSSNGKLNKSLLPDPEVLRLESHVNPSNEIEETLLKMWSEILNIEENKISTTSSFFDLGGNSLSAITLSNTILKTFSIDIALTDVFTKRTICSISDYIITVKQIEVVEDNKENVALLI